MIRNTRPLDKSWPWILEISAPTTRFSTALEDDCWTKRVSSFAPMEKPCQLTMALGVFVILRLPVPRPLICTLPCTTCGPVGFGHALPANASMTPQAIGRSLQT